NLDLASDVRLEVYNVLGSKIFVKNLGMKAAGSYDEIINVNQFPEGLYISKIVAGADEQVSRWVVNR
ncbi:MAG: T9SS type A sorting domain-containing protein, partial [Chitinophagales bacterium]